ncbi:hypothetical protein AKJ52_02770 [candidate division MSBL1 archaeon SCGC-AAA382C18]|uniref:Uncharacterized protein n=1 Tax=candidate division MSBL1 archaeon SCGC-AAA382C18 TaxID=1698281 RepID=A0A133VHN8_9EURY|nr:hypothetical protein AKJ52_02770 [candidate division MSBL1 archaeon SCGC-AAA382C18]
MDSSPNTEGINKILERHNPSKLDELVKSVCPFYEPKNREFSSIYLEFHELFKANLLTKLQLELEDLQIGSEKELDSGRVDGSVYEPDINNSEILLRNGDKEPICLAHLEVKTGKSVKILQSAAYAFQDEVPVILAEVSKAEVHLLDYETSVKLLEFARKQIDRLEKLEKEGKRIPDGYRCSSCKNEECRHNFEEIHQKSHSLVKEKFSQLFGNNGKVANYIVEIVKELVEERGLQTEEEGEVEKIES